MKRLSFSDDMMRALAAGEKTMTRRPEKRAVPAPEWFIDDGPGGWSLERYPVLRNGAYLIGPRCVVGDLVAATCAHWINDSGESRTGADYRFQRPGWEEDFGKARPARVMPAALAPFVLLITEVRAERLGDISEQDARREGAVQWFERAAGVSAREENICAGDCFAELWCHVYGDGAWDRDFDSWVWVYGFEIAERRI